MRLLVARCQQIGLLRCAVRSERGRGSTGELGAACSAERGLFLEYLRDPEKISLLAGSSFPAFDRLSLAQA